MADWALNIFREHNKEADFWAGKVAKKSGQIQRMWFGQKSLACVGFGTVAVNEARVVLG